MHPPDGNSEPGPSQAAETEHPPIAAGLILGSAVSISLFLPLPSPLDSLIVLLGAADCSPYRSLHFQDLKP